MQRRPSPAKTAEPPPGEERGFVLLTVLVVVLLASMLAVSLLFSMRAESGAEAASQAQARAWNAALSGVFRAAAAAQAAVESGSPWQNNPDAFQNQALWNDGADQWYFSVYAPGTANPPRFGLDDEASRLNLRNASAEQLAKLPGLEDESIVSDLLAAVRTLGGGSAEASNAPPADATAPPGEFPGEPEPSGLAVPPGSPGAAPEAGAASPSDGKRDGGGKPPGFLPLADVFAAAGLPVSAVEGAGGSAEAEDFGVPETGSPGTAAAAADSSAFGEFFAQSGAFGESQAPPLEQLLTACSYEPNVDSQGEPRINLNDPDLDIQSLELPDQTKAFLEALRNAGRTLSHPAELLEASETFQDRRGRQRRLDSGVGKAELPDLLDRYTAVSAPYLEGLINVNTAPTAVLLTIPGMDQALAEAIVAARPGLTQEERRTPAWVYTRGLADAETFRRIAPSLTARSYQFRFRVAGYGLPSGQFAVIEAVVDAAVRPARILMIRDLTRQGFPFSLDQALGAPWQAALQPAFNTPPEGKVQATTKGPQDRS